MLFLAGMDKKYELIEPSMTCHCLRCGKETQWSLYKETEWASLFFIPVWRFTADYLLLCHICQDVVKLSRPLGKQLLLAEPRGQTLRDVVQNWVSEHQKVE